ncbi:phytoene desaturase family protein [Anaeroplasma bactoclasticum]|jgi:phytoene dehydrogenase-like protein|nr:FAD-dependent oxidoreductase [Anaeroplasma bactoclasticum]
MKSVAIIGAGISGLASGIYLLKNGFDVTIYEKNSYAGGFLTIWKRKNSIIDGCMHWMQGSKDGTRLNKIWKELGAIDSKTEMIHPNSFCTVEYQGNVFHWYMDIDSLEKEFYKYSKDDDLECKIFIDAVRQMGIMEIPSDIPYELIDPKELKMDMNIMRKMRYYLSLSIGEVADRFHSEVIKYALKNCLVNEHFSAFYFIQTISNFTNGNSSIPKGCSKRMRDGILNKYLSLGGKIYYNSPVDEILIEDTKAIGIMLEDGKKYYADYIIPACDIHYLDNHILKGKYNLTPFKEYDNNKEKYPTYSYVIASYRTKMNFSNMDIAVIKKIEEYNFKGIKGDALSIRQYGYDEELITNGYSTVQVYLTTYEDDYEIIKAMSKEEYQSFKQMVGEFFKNKLMEYYQTNDFELIDVLTPLTYERYNNSYKGSFMTYALTPKVPQVSRSAFIDGLDNVIIANQWLMLPGGTGVAAVSGKFSASLILFKEGLNYKL